MSLSRWDSKGLLRTIEARRDRGLDAASQFLADDLRRTLSVSGQGQPAPVGRPPRRQSGALLAGVGVKRGANGVQVGIVDVAQRRKAMTLAKRRPYLPPTMRRSSRRLLGEFVQAAKR